MRSRHAVFVACAVLVAIVALAWFAASGADTHEGELARDVDVVHDAATTRETHVELEASVKAPVEAAKPVVEAARVAYSADSPLARGAIVLGALSARDGSPVLARSVHLDFWREKAHVAGLDNETMGVYRAGPFAPGTYRVKVSSERFDALEFQLVVPDDATTLVRDLVLTEPFVLVVHAQTPAGDPLASALMRMPEFDYSYFLDVVATTGPVELGAQMSSLAAQFPEESAGAFNRDLRALDGSDMVGTLRLRALPAFVHLTWARTVLASVRADENTHEVKLVLDPRKLAERFGVVRAQVVDADSGLAVAGAKVVAQQPQTKRETSGVTDVNGVCTLRGVSPELVELVVTNSEHCVWSRKLDVAPANITDAGIVSLARLVTLDVRVVDLAGKPVTQALEVIDLEAFRGDHRPMQIERVEVDVGLEGARVPKLDRRRYVVRSGRVLMRKFAGETSGERVEFFQDQSGNPAFRGENPFEGVLRVAPTLVDLTSDERRELVLTAAPASACSLQLGFERDRGMNVTIATLEGLVVGESFASGQASLALALLPGEYKIKVREMGEAAAERTFSVGSGPNVIHVP